MNSGFININKPTQMTSNDVVVKVRGILKKYFNDKHIKVGHLGTLDPNASGVLPISFGNATKLFDFMLEKIKVYKATFTFGYETDTLDTEGEKINDGGTIPTADQVKEVISSMKGEISQKPPIYSAKSINGVRAYTLARRGKDVTLDDKKVYIESITLDEINGADFNFTIVCGSGTYIRAIARDIAYALDTYATMTALKRTATGKFDIENAVCLDDFDKNPSKYFRDVDFAFDDDKIILLDKSLQKKALNGIEVKVDNQEGVYLVKTENENAYGVVDKNGNLKLSKRL
ncbi:MAG: tRNA pseudouridine(55) synthase TruB [Clostridia bacterium]|nr:tRNA pseudouridine(55) synthase TruB [Clostridia bacterium]